MLNKKAQFGPDFIVATVVVLLIGLGGVIFLQFFVGGLTMQGLLTILDTEYDQSCHGILMAMVSDEYVTTGEDVTGRPYFNNLAATYSIGDAGCNIKSVRFEKNMESFNETIRHINFNPGRITDMYYFLASRSNARTIREEIFSDIRDVKDQSLETYTVCSIPVFGVYEYGIAELYLRVVR